jgi:outer membrane lipoprotein-sorting protein
MQIRNVLLVILALVIATVFVARITAQRVVTGLPASVQDLRTAQVIEIKDGADHPVAKGSFVTSSEGPKELERSAALTADGTPASANGKAEIEVERSGDAVTKQELEVGLKNLPASTSLKLYVDGIHVMTFSTDRSGRADLKLTSTRPAAIAPSGSGAYGSP